MNSNVLVFLVFATAPKTLIKHQADWPFEIQWPLKWDTTSIKWRPNGTLFSKKVLPKTSSWKRIDFWMHLLALWLTFGTLWVPIGSMFFNCWYNCQYVSMLLAPTFEPLVAKHGPHPPIKWMQMFCQDLPTFCQNLQQMVRNKMRAYSTPHRKHQPLNTKSARNTRGARHGSTKYTRKSCISLKQKSTNFLPLACFS